MKVCGTCRYAGKIAGRTRERGRWITLLRCEQWNQKVRLTDACLKWRRVGMKSSDW
ncbi:MAG: hypothetical protein HFJ85_01190 [Oscillospiraceae bacterium]|nr:hypothetical protein [Oscillospiraceae bacterium]